jgi:outer membrane receptor protein involved in Fe transport
MQRWIRNCSNFSIKNAAFSNDFYTRVNTKLSLNVHNLFDKRPAFLSANTTSFYDNSVNPRGRYVLVGLKKSF